MWQRQRLTVKPGLTGLAQVNGLREQHSSEEKVHFDLQYIFHWSLFLDLSLVLQTTWTLLLRLVHENRLAIKPPLKPTIDTISVSERYGMLIVRSPVRISFAGGGTDLPAYYERFGGAVLSTSINKYFYTTLQKRTDGKIQVISSDLRVVETWRDISRMDVKSSALEIPLSVIKELQSDLSVDLFWLRKLLPGQDSDPQPVFVLAY